MWWQETEVLPGCSQVWHSWVRVGSKHSLRLRASMILYIMINGDFLLNWVSFRSEKNWMNFSPNFFHYLKVGCCTSDLAIEPPGLAFEAGDRSHEVLLQIWPKPTLCWTPWWRCLQSILGDKNHGCIRLQNQHPQKSNKWNCRTGCVVWWRRWNLS